MAEIVNFPGAPPVLTPRDLLVQLLDQVEMGLIENIIVVAQQENGAMIPMWSAQDASMVVIAGHSLIENGLAVLKGKTPMGYEPTRNIPKHEPEGDDS